LPQKNSLQQNGIKMPAGILFGVSVMRLKSVSSTVTQTFRHLIMSV